MRFAHCDSALGFEPATASPLSRLRLAHDYGRWERSVADGGGGVQVLAWAHAWTAGSTAVAASSIC